MVLFFHFADVIHLIIQMDQLDTVNGFIRPRDQNDQVK